MAQSLGCNLEGVVTFVTLVEGAIVALVPPQKWVGNVGFTDESWKLRWHDSTKIVDAIEG